LARPRIAKARASDIRLASDTHRDRARASVGELGHRLPVAAATSSCALGRDRLLFAGMGLLEGALWWALDPFGQESGLPSTAAAARIRWATVACTLASGIALVTAWVFLQVPRGDVPFVGDGYD
jgi:hypothetical protein